MVILLYTFFFISIPFLSILPPLLCFTPREKREDAIGQGFYAGIISMIATLILGLMLSLVGYLVVIALVGWLTHRAAQNAGAGERSFMASLSAMGLYVLFVVILISSFAW